MKRLVCLLLIVIVLTTSVVYGEPDSALLDQYKAYLQEKLEKSAVGDHSNGQAETFNAMWNVFWEYLFTDTTEPESIEAIYEKIDTKTQYTMTTIAGGNGVGYKDGHASIAKLYAIGSMTVDLFGNVYFVDQENKAIRKLDQSTGKITTYLKVDDNFDITLVTSTKKNLVYSYKDFEPTKVIYNPYDGYIYVAGNYEVQNGFNAIYRIGDTIEVAAFDHKPEYRTQAAEIYYQDFVKFDKDGGIWYSNRVSMYSVPTYLMYAEYGEKAVAAGQSPDHKNPSTSFPKLTGTADVIIQDDALYTFDTQLRQLNKVSMYPREVERIATYENFFNCVTSYKDKFYAARGADIYEISLDGTIKKFIDSSTLVIKGDKTVGYVDAMTFDSEGNLYIYDRFSNANTRSVTSGSLRKINTGR